MGGRATRLLYLVYGRRKSRVFAVYIALWVCFCRDLPLWTDISTALIIYFKPKPLAQTTEVVGDYGSTKNGKKATPLVRKGKKPKPTRAQLGQEIKFDLRLARCSLMMDMISHSLVTILPSPSLGLNRMQNLDQSDDFKKSQAMFVGASSLSGLGSGALPAIHSVALCMMQVRALDAKAAAAEDGQQEVDSKDEEGTGALFGALAVLQAVGQTILGVSLEIRNGKNGC